MSSAAARRLTATVIIAVAMASCGSDSSTTDTEASVDTDASTDSNADSSDSLDALVAEFVGNDDGGVEVLFDWDGTRQLVTAGTASNDGDALTPGQVFRVGSVSKTFIAAMVLQMVDEGTVDLEETLSAYLPDTAVGGDATIRQLLSHQSGIANYTDQPAYFANILADPEVLVERSEVLAYVADEPVESVDEFAYSNTNYILLGQLVEAIDDSDLNTSLSTRITGPLALENTVFDTGDTQLPDGLVGGWSLVGNDGDPAAPYAALASSAWSAGSLVSTTDDLATFLAALSAGELMSDDSLEQMTDTDEFGYGLGVFQVGFSPAQSGIGHSGGIPGFTSTMAIDPSTGDTLVILTNSDDLVADELAFEILTTL